MAKDPAKKTSPTKPAAAKKTTASKTAVKKPTVKKVAEKKPADKKASSKKLSVSPFERYKMIEVAAYYKAEKDGFKAHAADYWVAAEKDIDKKVTTK